MKNRWYKFWFNYWNRKLTKLLERNCDFPFLLVTAIGSI